MKCKFPTIAISLLTLLFAFAPAIAQEHKRLALVIGNAAYPGDLALDNPVNDAEAIAKSLKSVGFQVILKSDRTKEEIEADVAEVTGNLFEGDAFLFYYSGHGIESNKVQFLQPIDAVIKTDADIKSKCVDTDWILEQARENEASMKVVIVDACRTELKAKSAAIQFTTRSFRPAPEGTIMAYATESGKEASDGSGSNSPYTKWLVEVLDAPHESGLEIRQWLRSAARKAKDESGQRSFVYADWSMDPFLIKTTGVALIDQENPNAAFNVQLAIADQQRTQTSGFPEFHVGDKVEIEIESEADGFLTLVAVDSEGTLDVLLPNEWHPGHFKVSANQKVVFPTADMGFKIKAQPPLGRALLKAIVTKRKLTIKGADARGKGIASLGNLGKLQTRSVASAKLQPEKANEFDVRRDTLKQVFESDEWATATLTTETLPKKK